MDGKDALVPRALGREPVRHSNVSSAVNFKTRTHPADCRLTVSPCCWGKVQRTETLFYLGVVMSTGTSDAAANEFANQCEASRQTILSIRQGMRCRSLTQGQKGN